ncbi:SMP-30/gluconolactonase/LRE family protein [Massilia cavernae]|uniref:SMP-30/gluconolactonase/LRE family protein n=2 Tax=Massilia cavernae TaxID=2320864 RepID=A0A418Y123_9BURK|nr:SMP-30/gluconolactonase/LRE family protein [Massilia cavernae]
MTQHPFEVAYDAPMSVGESPLWHPTESSLYWVDINGFTIHRLNQLTGTHDEWRLPSEPTALALCATGGLVVAMRAGFFHFNPQDGALAEIAPAPYDTSTTRFNDGRVDAAGRFWVGTMYEPRDQQAAQMFCLDKGEVKLKWSGGMTVSNGLAFSLDATAMYHADTTSHRVDRYDFDAATGTASHPSRFQQFSTDKARNYGGRPDGAAVDSEGAYWVAMIEGAGLLRFAPDGELLDELQLPVRCPTMMAFGGDDLRTLFITSLGHRPAEEIAQFPLTGRLLSLRVDVPGRVENAYQP